MPGALTRTTSPLQELLKERAINSLALLEEHAELKRAYNDLEAKLQAVNDPPEQPEEWQEQLQQAREARQLAERDYFRAQKDLQNAQDELAAVCTQQEKLCQERDAALKVGCN